MKRLIPVMLLLVAASVFGQFRDTRIRPGG